MVAPYDNSCAEDNVYGHVVKLLGKVKGHNSVHLDIGCGFGRIAEQLCRATGAEYVGIDCDDDGLNSLKDRGFRAVKIDLNDLDRMEEAIRASVQGRTICSMSLIDVLEHVPDPTGLMDRLRRIAEPHFCPLIVAVPNITHRDVGIKLAFGRWDITRAGILDRSHLHFFSRQSLKGVVNAAGWHEADTADFEMCRSDQHFPADHPALADASLLSQFLGLLADSANADAHVYRFVRSYFPGPLDNVGAFPGKLEGEGEGRPFLSVITRTQGARIEELRETLLSLTAQSCQDFEVLVIGHKLDVDRQLKVERVIEDLPRSMRSKTRLLRIDYGNRTVPLNVGFMAANGVYACIVDDDDVVLGHWVETWFELAEKYPGRVLRANVARQDFSRIETSYAGRAGLAAVSGLKLYPSEFDLFAHLFENQTPGLGMAFPLSAFRELNIRFDEELTTAEDWDLFLRTGLICGFSASQEVVAIYRWWRGVSNSATDHSVVEWDYNRHKVYQKIDRLPILLPPGSVRRLHKHVNEDLQIFWDDFGVGDQSRIEYLRKDISVLLNSASWRITAPLRGVVNKLKRKPGPAPIESMNSSQLAAFSSSIRNSTSWKLTRPARVLKRLMKR
jgi:hypothetical protein